MTRRATAWREYASLRSYRPLKVQQHRATSEVLGGAYPFLAEAGLGEKGIYLGSDSYSSAAFCFDPWTLYADGVLTNPNILLAGVIGKGKSTCAKCLATRSIAFGRKVYVPGDPKGEWAGVSRAVGGQAIELGGGLPARLNPLDEGPRSPAKTEAEWRAALTPLPDLERGEGLWKVKDRAFLLPQYRHPSRVGSIRHKCPNAKKLTGPGNLNRKCRG